MKTQVSQSIARKCVKFAGLALLCAGATVARAQYVSTVVTNLSSPNDIAVDPNGIAYITEAGSNVIVEYVPTTGASSIFVGSPGLGGTNNGLGGLAQFSNPYGILYVPSLGGLVVADENNQDLRLVTLSGVVSTLAGRPGVIGDANGPAASATFEFPTALALDATGTNLYIADSGNNDIRVLTTGNLQVSTLQVANYTFKFPEGLTVDANNNLWVADTKDDDIVVISNVNPASVNSATIIAGTKGFAGSKDDAYNALNALFNGPTSVLWDSAVGGLLVADTGNDTIREVYQTNGAWATRLMAGIPGTSGVNNATPLAATFSQPTGLASDSYDFGFYIVDRANGVVRALQPSAPEAQVTAPTFGFVTFPPAIDSGEGLSLFTASSNAMLDNFDPPRIAIKTEPGTETYITYGATPLDPLQNPIAIPGPLTGISPETYRGDGLTESQSAPSILSPLPDVTMYAISYAAGRPSSIVSARFKFEVDNPVIDGLNAASVTLSDATSNSLIYYTLDGSVPDDGGSNAASIGPVSSGEVLSFNIATNTTINVRAFRQGFAPSGVSTETLILGNQVFNELTLGFPTGQEASSVFRATQGETFVAPVTLTLLADAVMYTLQFNVTVTNVVPAPPPTDPAGYQYGFSSMLEMPITNGYFATIEPLMFAGGTNFVSGQFTNSTENLLGVGWVETFNKTNLYPSSSQDLIAYSHAQDDQFLQSGGKVVVGGYSFVVPKNAQLSNVYQVQLGRPSASADGIGERAAPLAAPTNGSLTVGTINAIKDITVVRGGIHTNELSYLVGDVNAFHWFNIGDFGDGNLDASDVEEVFKSAIYTLNIPVTNSALYDAMDSANVTGASDPALFSADGATINSSINAMLTGDGRLDIADVYVTFRRSLDPSLAWVRRYYDANGNLISTNVPNGPSLENSRPVSRPLGTVGAKTPNKTGASGVPHTISLAADQVIASTSTVVVPLRVTAADPTGLPIRYLMFDAQIQPLDGSPALTAPVTFTATASLGAPSATLSQGPQDMACLWMSTNNPGFSGTGIIGTVSFALPVGVNANSSYLVSFQNVSASPNGLGVYTASVQNGLVTLSDRSRSSWSDGIPDSWRLVHFGTISNPASAATSDPDGDGASNWQEYIAGTDPMSAASVFKLQAAPVTGNVFTLQWPSVVGKTYILESASSPNAGWSVLTNVSGTGATMSWPDSSASAQAKFYRATVQ